MRALGAVLDPRPSARTPAMTPAVGGLLVAAGGLAAISAARRRRGAARIALGMLGGGLVYRGLTGASLAERLLDLDTVRQPRLAIGPRAWSIADDGTLVVMRSITIARTSDVIDAMLADPAVIAVLSPSVDQSEPAADGSVRWTISFGRGRELSLDVETFERDPGRSTAWRIRGGPFRDATLRIEERERPPAEATEVTATVRIPPAAGRWMPRGLVARAIGLELDELLGRMRSLAEVGELATTEGQPAGAGRAPGPIAARADRVAERAGLPDDAVRPASTAGGHG